jgi:hypothetical protein
MKIVVTPPVSMVTQHEPLKLPCLMRSKKEHKQIVLMTDDECGILVSSALPDGFIELGEYCTSWVMSAFERCPKGTIVTLEQNQ